ncbi:hypothetical protein [Saccharothrix xinjiangensis]|uniref:Uncharacterized protein n=1 Tax=Saccharothrix xinjiangensis TaxID=204798 RepID=A0ABV9YFL1_9PSEU
MASGSPRFVELGDAGIPSPAEPSRRKTVDRPAVDCPAIGPITLDRDTSPVARDGLRVAAHTAESGTEDAARLVLAGVLGTRSLRLDLPERAQGPAR